MELDFHYLIKRVKCVCRVCVCVYVWYVYMCVFVVYV